MDLRSIDLFYEYPVYPGPNRSASAAVPSPSRDCRWGLMLFLALPSICTCPSYRGCRAIPGPWLWPSFSWAARPGFRALSGSGLAGSHGSRRRHRKSYGSGREDPHGYSQSRLRFDMVTMAFLLSLFFGGDKTLVVLGVGTIVSAMTVGRLVNFFNRRLFFIERLARLSLEDQNESPVPWRKKLRKA